MAGQRVLIRGCETVVTMDDDGTEIAGGSILIEDGVISWVGGDPPPETADPTGNLLMVNQVDGSGCVAMPGLVNTHHHMYQAMTRVHAQEKTLFGWLVEQYPIWAGVDAGWERAAARVALAELALSGCTLTTDHHYVFPPGRRGLLEAEIDAATDLGVRFHPCRGSMDLSQKDGGLPPHSVVQDTDGVLAETETAVKQFHDPSPGSMLRIAVAPCSPFSATDRLMRESVDLARRLGVRLHTHIAETIDEEEHCLERFGRRPVDLLDEQGFLGDDVWLAHCVHLSDADVTRLAASGTGVAWCPASNLRIGSGIARVREMVDAGVDVGLGVDGSASNDTGHLLGTARIGLLSARAPRDGGMGDPAALTVRDVLRIATRGGAACLGRSDEVGSLEPGKRGDVALVPVDGLAFAGAERDLAAAVLLCAPPRVRHLFVDGRAVVRDGRLATADEDEIAAEGRRMAARIVAGEVVA
jgi:cytosine/adenosine deaminase-related metal-dependent hydrolase